MFEYLAKHQATVAVVGFYIFSTAASSMAPPAAESGNGYKFIYKFLNGLMANVTALRGKAQFEEDTAKPAAPQAP